MSRWFRHYAGMMRDEKLVRAALRAKQPIERVVWVWGAMLESAAEVNDDGRFDLEKGEVAYFLRADEADIISIWDALEAMGRIRADTVVKWGDRQFQSDSSVERQRRLRERRQREVSEDNLQIGDAASPSPSRHGDAPDTDTDTDTEIEAEKKKNIRAVASATRPSLPNRFVEFWNAYPKRHGANPKDPARRLFDAAVKSGHAPEAIIGGAARYRESLRLSGQEGSQFVAQASTWLRQARWEDYPEGMVHDPPAPPFSHVIPGFSGVAHAPTNGLSAALGKLRAAAEDSAGGFGSGPEAAGLLSDRRRA